MACCFPIRLSPCSAYTMKFSLAKQLFSTLQSLLSSKCGSVACFFLNSLIVYSWVCLTQPDYLSVHLKFFANKNEFTSQQPILQMMYFYYFHFIQWEIEVWKDSYQVSPINLTTQSNMVFFFFFRDCLKYRWYIAFACFCKSSAFLQISLRFSRQRPQNKEHENEWLLLKNLF